MASAAVLRALRGPGRVEFALSPGGYVRFGDDFVLVATPRAPRGPLTLPVAGLAAAPLAPGDRARIDGGVLRVGAHAIALWRGETRRHATTPRGDAASGDSPPLHGAALAAALGAVAPPPRALLPGLAALRRGDLEAAVALLAGRGDGLTPAGDDVLAGYAAARGVRLSELAAGRASPLGLAYLRCAERGELPDVVARVLEARDPATARRRARALSRWGSSSGAAMLWGIASAT